MAEEIRKETQEPREEVEAMKEAQEGTTENAAETEEFAPEESPEENAAEETPSEETASEEEEENTKEEEPAAAQSSVPAPTLPEERIQAAKEKVAEANREIQSYVDKARKEFQQFEKYEKSELLPVLEESCEILTKVGIEEELPVVEGKAQLPKLELENPEEERLEIPAVSSGKGGAFFWALLGGVATLAGWYAFAAERAGLPLIPKQLPQMPQLEKLSATIADLFGQGAHAPVGAAIIIGSTLVVMWIIYMVIVAVRRSHNQRLAEEVEKQAEEYCERLDECKAKMNAVEEQVKNLDNTVHKYEVLLKEMNAGINRALYIEEVSSFDELHDKTKEQIERLKTLLEEIEKLLETPIARSGELTPESVETLREAKRMINDEILRLYS
ncbi:hypothetical protein [Nitratifractor sp.]